MVKDERADTSFGVHHESLSQLDPNILGPQQLPEFRLILQIRACGVPKAIAFPVIARREPVLHRGRRRVGEAPIFTNPAMQPLRASFCGLNGQRLQAVRLQIFAVLFGLFRVPPNAFAREATNIAIWSRLPSCGSIT